MSPHDVASIDLSRMLQRAAERLEKGDTTMLAHPMLAQYRGALVRCALSSLVMRAQGVSRHVARLVRDHYAPWRGLLVPPFVDRPAWSRLASLL